MDFKDLSYKTIKEIEVDNSPIGESDLVLCYNKAKQKFIFKGNIQPKNNSVSVPKVSTSVVKVKSNKK